MIRFPVLLVLLLLVTPGCAQSLDEIRAYVRREEGVRLSPYLDSTGHWTIGVGHRCGAMHAPITSAQAEAYLTNDLVWATRAAFRLTPHFERHPKAVRLMIISLVYNLGESGYEAFYSFRAALDRRDYHAAAHRLSLSLWSRQLPARSARYCRTLRAIH